MVLTQGSGARPAVGRAVNGVECVHSISWRENDAFLGHHFQQLWILVKVGAMLDGIHTDLDSHSQALSTKCVTHNTPPSLVSLIHQCLKFIPLEENVLWSQTGCRARPTGRCRLYHVRTCAHHLAHFGAHTHGPVRHAPWQAGVFTCGRPVSQRTDPVAHSAGWRDESKSNLKPRSRHQAFIHSQTESRIQPARVPYRGVTSLQGLVQYRSNSKMARAARLRDTPTTRNLVAEGRQMVMRVDQSRHQGHSIRVNRLDTLWNLNAACVAGCHN